MSEKTLPTLAFARFDACMLLVVDKRTPSSSDWAEWATAYSEAARHHGVRRLLAVSAGGGPNAAQRRELVARMVAAVGDEVESIRTAACGDAPMVRIVTAAFGWLNASPRMRVFPLDGQREALHFLGVPASRQADVLATAQRLGQQLRSR